MDKESCTCPVCHDMIDPDRVEFLTETGRNITCVKCASEKPAIGLMDYSHKTAPVMVVLPNGDSSSDQEARRLASRAFNRER